MRHERVITEGLRRSADVRPSTFDEATRTFEAVIATTAPVKRRDSRGLYREQLDISAVSLIALERTPVLNNHRQASATDVVGVVTGARRETGALIGTIQLTSATDVEPIAARARDGHVSLSIGYRELESAESVEGGERVRTVVPQIFEVSLVAVPADRTARIRSREMEDDVETMPPEQADQIRSLAEIAGLSRQWAEDRIDENLTLEEARTRAHQDMQRRSREVKIRAQSPPAEDPAIRVRAMEEALSFRVNGGAPSEAARPFMAHTLRDFAREVLTLRGISTAGMDADQLFRAAMHTASDFGNLLQGVGNRTLLPAYQAAQSPLRVLAREGSRNDFRPGSKLRLGEIGLLQKVGEAGEIKSTSRAEAATSYAIDTYASTFAISRKALINDDLGAFRDWGIAAGQAAAATEAQLLFDLLTQSNGAGPVMDDKKRLFHVDHGNLNNEGYFGGSPKTMVLGLDVARRSLRAMKGLDGTTPIQVTPKYLVVGPERETIAEKALAELNAAKVDDVNPFASKLTLLVEPRITDYSWYVFADPGQLPCLEYAYLSGAKGPQLSSREGWETLSTEFRVVLDFGCGAVDWRGAHRNIGNDDPDL